MKPSILIVDDHFSFCCGLAQMLHKNYIVHRAFNGRDALELYRKHREIEIILTDINMPVMDGFELIEKVRLHNKDIAIIAMTAICTEDIISEIIEKGADRYLSKPLDISDLKTALQDSLAHVRAAGTLYPHIPDKPHYPAFR